MGFGGKLTWVSAEFGDAEEPLGATVELEKPLARTATPSPSLLFVGKIGGDGETAGDGGRGSSGRRRRRTLALAPSSLRPRPSTVSNCFWVLPEKSRPKLNHRFIFFFFHKSTSFSPNQMKELNWKPSFSPNHHRAFIWAHLARVRSIYKN